MGIKTIQLPRRDYFTDHPWQTPTLLNSWANYANGYTTAGYWKDDVGMVHLKGLLKTGTTGTAAFNLPSSYRVIDGCRGDFLALGGDIIAGIEIQTTGDVVANGSAVSSWVALDGIIYPSVDMSPKLWNPIGVNTGFSANVSTAPVSWYKDVDGMVYLRGALSLTAFNGVAFTLPPEARPKQSVFMPAKRAISVTLKAVEILSNGDVISRTNATTNTTLDGIRFPAADSMNNWRPIGAMYNSWAPYDAANYCGPTYFRDRHGVVHLSGVIKSGTMSQVITVLPNGYKPVDAELNTAIFKTWSNGVMSRIDIGSNGHMYASSPGSNADQVLDGISFRAGNYYGNP